MKTLKVCLICLLLLGCQQQSVHRNIITSPSYSHDEVNKAMDTVEDFFQKNFNNCTLIDLWYDGNKEIDSQKAWVKQYAVDEAIVLLSNFKTDKNGGDGSLNPNAKYTDWQWILVRDKQENWYLETWGY